MDYKHYFSYDTASATALQFNTKKLLSPRVVEVIMQALETGMFECIGVCV